jgi:hypothetical protein
MNGPGVRGGELVVVRLLPAACVLPVCRGEWGCMYFILCILYCVFYIVYFILCILYCVFYIVYFILFILYRRPASSRYAAAR